MFCAKCGVEIKDNAKFCPKCGASTEEKQEEVVEKIDVNAIGNQVAIKNGFVVKNLTKIVVLAIVALALIFGVSSLFGKKGYEKVVDKYVDAYMDADAKGIAKLMHDDYFDVLIETGYIANKKDWIEGRQYYLDANELSYIEDYGFWWKYDYTIEYEKEFKADEDIKFSLGYYFSEDVVEDVKKAAEVRVSITVSGEGETGEVANALLTLAKIKGKWYLVNSPSY